jgi:uncharacterized protein DUF4154
MRVGTEFAVSLRVAVASLWMIGALNVTVPQSRADESSSQDAVKAAYLYRFVGYVGWPADGPVATPFTIAVFDAPGVARELRQMLPGHPLNGGVAQIREISRVQDCGTAQVLFVGAGHADVLNAVNPRVVSQSMLMVTDEAGGLQSGSVLNFLTIDHRVRFEISLSAAEKVHLRVSSELLSIAVRVQGTQRQSDAARAP